MADGRGLSAQALMRITKIETIPLRLPVKKPLVESGGTFDVFNHVIVKVSADTGVFGLGEVEAYPSFERPGVETQEGIVAIIRDYLGPCLKGQNPFSIIAIWEAMDRAVTGYLRVKAALDIALYDLLGKHLGVPTYDLLGGKVRDSYVVEGVGYGISIDAPGKVAAIAKKAVRDGYRQLEFKAGDERPERDIERLVAVRRAIGPDVPVKVDFNGFYETKTALSLIREMERVGIQWIEQPARYWDLEGLALIRKNVTVKIVVDESVESPQDMMRIVAHQAADCVHIKPTIKGGFTTARQIAAVAEAAGIAIVPGSSAPSGVGSAAVQAFVASTRKLSGGTHGAPLDILVEDVVKNPIPAGSTVVRISSKPGLGIELDDKKVRKYRVD